MIPVYFTEHIRIMQNNQKHQFLWFQGKPQVKNGHSDIIQGWSTDTNFWTGQRLDAYFTEQQILSKLQT